MSVRSPQNKKHALRVRGFCTERGISAAITEAIEMSFWQNCCRPQGWGGRIMVAMMNMGHAPMAKWGLKHLQLAPDAAALDIGCGGGANLKRLLEQIPRGKVSGLDYSEVSVAESRRLNQEAVSDGRCEVLQGNVMALPFPDAAFDVVTAFETVYFWPDIDKAFAQVHRVLKAGGSFMICNDLNGEDVQSIDWTKKIEGMRVHAPEAITEALLAAGFAGVQTDRHGRGWICFTAVKP